MRMESPPLVRGCGAASSPGVTLLELLVASSVALIVLGAAWAWLWGVQGVATRMDEDAQAATILAVAARAVARDVHEAVAVLPPAPGRDPAASLHLQHDGVDSAPEEVVIAWDAGRQVLWRNASGTYLSDHVTGFDLSYLTDDGRLVKGQEATTSDLATVRAVCVALSVRLGESTLCREVRTDLGES